MPKWEQYLTDEEDTPKFEKFEKNLKVGRRILKQEASTEEEKEQRKREIDEKRASKRRDEV